MDLIGRLRAWAVASPRVLVVDVPGSRPLRWAVEAELDGRGWTRALSPSDADLLLVLGAPGPELAAAVELLWGQMALPRHRVDLLTESEVRERLAAAPHELAAAGEEADDSARDAVPVQARSERVEPMDHSGHEGLDQSGPQGMDHSGHEGMDQSGPQGMDQSGHEGMEPSGHEGMEPSGEPGHTGMEHSGHEAMDHSGMGGGDHSGHHMHHGGEVAGLPMAETAPDRDGLALDVLRVSLGPVLPGWPTGLLLRAELQGDVVTSAQLSWLDAGQHTDADRGADPRRTALDHLASLLEVAGWSTAARDVRLARDGLASPDPGERARADQRARRVLRRVRRSRPLAWSLRGVGCLVDRRSGTDGDVLDRMRRWCEAASDGAGGSAPGVVPLDEVATVLQGSEVGAARLIVASLELQRKAVRAEPEVVGA